MRLVAGPAGRNWVPASVEAIKEEDEQELRAKPEPRSCNRSDVALLLLGVGLLVAFVVAGYWGTPEPPSTEPSLRQLLEQQRTFLRQPAALASAVIPAAPHLFGDAASNSSAAAGEVARDASRRLHVSLRMGVQRLGGRVAALTGGRV